MKTQPNAKDAFITGFYDGLLADSNISRIEAYETVPVDWHEFIDDYLNGHDDGVARDWFRVEQMTVAA